MKKSITILFSVLTGLLSAQTVSIQGGSSYPTISEAITASVDGDVILISGLHTESVTVDKSITLRGENPETDIIQAAASPGTGGTGSRVLLIGAPTTSSLNVTVENLTIRHGNAGTGANGGGIFVDKVIGLVTLRNLNITNNFTIANGGGLGFAGSNVNVINCTIQNNTANGSGGGVLAAPNNASGVSNVVSISQSLINANTALNGGGLFINGNNGFGNNYRIDVNFENATISNNNATSAASGNGGGAIFTQVAVWTTTAGGDGTSGNVTIKMVHTTVFNNNHAALLRAGLRFAGTAGILTNFSAYNSIIVANNDVNVKALNFQNTNTTNVVNCILGGLENAPLSIVDDPDKNNLKGRTATQAGLSGTLSNLGGSTAVLDIIADSNAVNFCTADTGDVIMPTIDQRGYNREGVNDAGAYELGGTLLSLDNLVKVLDVIIYPNPTTDYLFFKCEDQISKIKIFDLNGKLVLQSDSYQQGIDVSKLSAGIHLVMIEIAGQQVVKSVMIQ